ERQGYTVLTAGNGNEALQIWQESREQIELVITDVIMPGGMNGVELTQTLLQDRPNVKVIYVSGFSALRGITGAEFVEGENFVSKPYTLADLGRTLRKVLDS
ncbi:MAG: response regulator, partial [Leptospiraceae bacterium]|nr:response regulator [Leptospiraceae bacterium]